MQSARLVQAEGEAPDVGRDMRSGSITGLFPTADGYLYLSANTSHFWQALCERTGLADLADDPRYDSVRRRAAHANELVPRRREVLLTRTAAEWEDRLADAVPCAAARPVEDMFDDPQVAAEGLIARVLHPTLGSYRGVTRLIAFARTPSPEPFAAPLMDQDGAGIRVTDPTDRSVHQRGLVEDQSG